MTSLLAAQTLARLGSALPNAEVTVEVTEHEMALTRFAESVIHQNVAEELVTVRVLVHHEGRTATTTGTVTGSGDLPAIVDRVVASVAVAPLDPAWPGLAPPAPAGPTAAPDPGTAHATPADRAAVVAGLVDGAGGLESAGYCRTTRRMVSFVDSAGQTVDGEAAECGLAGVVRTPLSSGTGLADGVARLMPLSLASLDGHALGARAAAKARAWTEPVDLEPGRYEVVLEPDAVLDLVGHVGGWALNGRMVNERQSFAALGADQFSPLVTLVDDPTGLGVGFDAEGTPQAPLTLVDAGRTVAVTHDRRTAAEAGASSTGHAFVGHFSFGPVGRHLGLLPSGDGVPDEVDGPVCDSSAAALVAGMERGLLVSDFWYTRVLDPRTLSITGLTRNGVWLVEDGDVVAPVTNLRFTQAYADALSPANVRAIGATSTPIPGDTYTATSPRFGCPALHLASWNFTGGAAG